MPERYSNRLSEVWLKAAVLGSFWASFEIIIGSFLHNLRFPFSGTILSFASVGLIIAFIQVWKIKGLVWRAGLVAALLKSISPSAIILGPMIGIFTEAIIIEICVFILGRNLPAYLLSGALAVLSTLLHKIVSLLVTYGFDLLIIVEEVYQYVVRQIGMTKGEPMIIVLIVISLYTIIGMAGAMLGFIAGRRAMAQPSAAKAIRADSSRMFFNQEIPKRSSPLFLLFHILCVVSCLYMVNVLPLWYALIPSLVYAVFCLYTYRKSTRSFKKISFWVWFMAITILAAVFWNGLSKGEIWDWEGLIVGLRMNVRAVVILTGFAAISHEMRNPIIRTVLYNHGFANVYHSVGMAFTVLPGIVDTLPGIKRLMKNPVGSLTQIIGQTIQVYPVLIEEMSKQTPVFVITGEIQEGKTTYLIRLLEKLTERDIRVNGFIATGIHDQDGRIGYDLEHVVTGEQMQFIRNSPSDGAWKHGKYYFNPSGLSFGKEILEAIREDETDLVIIDEVGPVELKGKGWAGEIDRLIRNYHIPQLWVVRKTLLRKVIRNWPLGEVVVADIARDNEDALLREILKLLEKQ